MTMSDWHWTDRLSEYVDGELTAAERSAVDAHLEVCAECRDALAELRSIVDGAGRLPDLEPERDLWPGIGERLTPRGAAATTASTANVGVLPLPRRRRVVVTIPQLAAAAIALMLLSAGGVWMALPGRASTGTGPATASAELAGPPVVTLASSYDQAVEELETEFQGRRGALDPETIVVVERNLAIIDQAIAEATTALAADPSSGFLNAHLASAMHRKLNLLRTATKIDRWEM